MDTRRRGCLCSSAAPVRHWLRSIRSQTFSEDVYQSIGVQQLIASKLTQSTVVDDDMTRTWLQSLCPCLHHANASTDEQDQRLHLVANQSNSSTVLDVLPNTLVINEVHQVSADQELEQVPPIPEITCVDVLASPVTNDSIEIVEDVCVAQARKRNRPRQPTLPRISELVDSHDLTWSENLKFARQISIPFSECYEIVSYQPLESDISRKRRSRLYSEPCHVGGERPLPASWQHHRHSWPFVTCRSNSRSPNRSSVFLPATTTVEENPVGHILFHNSQLETLEPEHILTCADACEAYSWNDALVWQNRLSHSYNLAEVSLKAIDAFDLQTHNGAFLSSFFAHSLRIKFVFSITL